jgi:hypothetical protein
VRGTMISSSASQVLGSPSTGSLDGCQLMEGSFAVWEIIAVPRRHCERSEAIHTARKKVWIASSLALLAMTAVSTYAETEKIKAGKQ